MQRRRTRAYRPVGSRATLEGHTQPGEQIQEPASVSFGMKVAGYAWAAGICGFGPWIPTPSNLKGLNGWIGCEKPSGEPGQWNNPLNTTDRQGASGIAKVGPGISIFPTPAAGAKACANTIKGKDGMQGWPRIESALKRGNLGSALAADAAGLLSNWGTSPTCVESSLGGKVKSEIGGGSGGSGAGGSKSNDTASTLPLLGLLGAGGIGTVVVVAGVGVAAYFMIRKARA